MEQRIHGQNRVPFLDLNEAASFLGVKRSAVYSWVHKRRIPFRKHGGLLRFDPAALNAWSKAQEFEALKR